MSVADKSRTAGRVSPSLRRPFALAASGARRFYGKAAKLVAGLRTPITESDLRATLASLGAPPVVVTVHSSLSACGYVRGGAQTVVSALRAWCAKSTLVMPTHTYCYPLDGDAPIFDVKATSSKVGSITNAFMRGPNVWRSLHPTHSLAAEGPLARELIEGHEACDTPCGAGTPYERLLSWDSGVLMLGVTLECYTLFHTAEDAAQVPYLYETQPYDLRVKGASDQVISVRTKRQNMRIARRFSEMDDWFQDRGLLERRRLGSGELLWVAHSKYAHEALVANLQSDAHLLVKESAGQSSGEVV